MKNLLRKAAAAGATIAATSILFATTVSAQTYLYDNTYTPSDAAAATGMAGAFYGMNLLIICCACCIPLIISIALFVFVYKDAQKNNVENPILWAILSFTWVGFLIYFLAIRPDAIKKTESNSGSTPVSTPTAS